MTPEVQGVAHWVERPRIKEIVMGRLGPLEIIIIAAVVLVLFGRGKISNLMGEVGKGITAFKRGVKDGSAEAEAAAAAAVEAARDVTPETEKEKA